MQCVGKWRPGVQHHRPWAQFCVSYGKMLLPLGRHREGLILLYLFMVSH